MDWAYVSYLLPQLMGAIIPILLIYDIYPKREKLIAKMFILFLLSAVIWSASYFFQLVFFPDFLIFLFNRLSFIGVMTLPVFWLSFALLYSGNEKFVNKKNLALLLLIPFINLLLLFTNPLHHLFYQRVFFPTVGPLRTTATIDGPIFWFHIIYSYGLLLLGVILILKEAIKMRDLYIKQSVSMILGVLVTLVSNGIFLSGLSPIDSNYDLTVVSFSFSAIAFWYAVFKLRFLDILPIAKDTVFESISDAIFVLGKENRISDYNQNAKKMIEEDVISYPDTDIIGVNAEKVFGNRPDAVEKYHTVKEARCELELTEGENGPKRYFDMRLSPVNNKNDEFMGRVVILRDITERKEAEERAEFLHSLLRHNLGNKLQVTMGFLELLEESNISDEHKEFLDDSLNSIEEGKDLIENVGTLQKVESGKIDEKIEPVNLKKVVEESVQRHNDLRKELGFEINNKIEDQVTVKAGKILKEIFANLIENSLIHSEGSRLNISLAKEKEKVKVILEDDGKGIPDDMKDKITKKGEKGKDSSGSGLGMNLVKNIAETYGGELKIKDSELGGARFEVFLNRYEV